MAAAITLNAATAEQQALELGSKLSQIIADYKAANPNADLQGLSVTRSINLGTRRATFNFTVPLAETNSPDGGVEFDAQEVMTA